MTNEEIIEQVLSSKTRTTRLTAEVASYEAGRSPYGDYRASVFNCIAQVVSDWSNKNKVDTSIIAFRIFTRLIQSVATQSVLLTYYESQPKWAQEHTQNLAAFFPPAANGRAESKYICFYSPQPQEIQMEKKDNASAVETKTFIFGTDAKLMRDNDIMTIINDLQSQITEIERLTAKPQRLVLRVEELKKQIADIIAAVDAADAKQ